MRTLFLALVLPPILVALPILLSLERQSQSPLEQQFLDAGNHLLQVTYACPPETAGRIIEIPPETFQTHQLYLVEKDDETEYFLTRASGELVDRREVLQPLDQGLQLVYTPERAFAFANGTLVIDQLQTYDMYWVTRDPELPVLADQVLPRLHLTDDFARDDLPKPGCQVVKGDWTLTDAERLASLQGSLGAHLHYGAEDWFNYHGEARFYFGLPPTTTRVDRQTLPVGTDMLVAQGQPGSLQVAFGWQGSSRQFVLLSREGEGEWMVRDRYTDSRPPLTNWYRLGLQVRDGWIAEGYLDGKRVAEWQLPRILQGGFSLLAGAEPMLVDDLRIEPLPRPGPAAVAYGWPASEPDRADPAIQPYMPVVYVESGLTWTGFRTSLPLPGDFVWEPRQAAADGTPLPAGRYRLALFSSLNELQPGVEALINLEFHYEQERWTLVKAPAVDVAWTGRRLRITRQADRPNELLLLTDQESLSLTDKATGPFFLRFAHAPMSADEEPQAPLSLDHISLTSTGIVHQQFEQAPADWRWVEGAFRPLRSDEGGGLVGGGPGVPFMSSRQVYQGNQIHRFSLALQRPDAMDVPVQAGAADPVVEPDYQPRDLCFSFCTDGLNPMSGYTVIMGGRNNTQSVLYRRGVPVQRLNDPEALLPAPSPQGETAWLTFIVVRLSSRIQVYLRGELLFDFIDSKPLDDGHIGFWTMRNRFAVRDLHTWAEGISTPMPQLMHVPADTASPWKPLIRDTVSMTRGQRPGLFTITATTGAGYKGIRYQWDEPVDLRERPLLSLPLSLTGETAIHLYAQIDDKPYLVRIYGPIDNLQTMLVPAYEHQLPFSQAPVSEVEVRRQWLLLEQTPAGGLLEIDLLAALEEADLATGALRLSSLTLGNTSNVNYLLAGNGGNRAGTTYEVGIPVMRESPVQENKGILNVP